MTKRIALVAMALCVAFVGIASADGHYKLGKDWVQGEFGNYIVVDESTTNRVLCASSFDTGDPKHAWVNKDFGSDYTVKCDVMMLTWANDQDLSRAGIVGRLQPNGTAVDGDHDRGVNLLLHDDYNTVQFLNDLRGWGDSQVFAWTTRTWYTFVLTFSGNTVSGSITNKSKATETIELPAWEFVHPEERTAGFVGITASTLGGLVAYYDNFEVSVGGQVVFSDDFEGTAAAPSAMGTNKVWKAGKAGYYVVYNGKLYAIATNGTDPKHMWYNKELVGGGSITADVTMMSWDSDTTHDHSRAGLALHIQPDGTNEGTGDRGICLLFHQELTQVQFLNDNRAWATAETFAWTVGTKYVFSMSSDGTTVSGSIGDHAMTDWAFPDPQNRTDGFAGVTASTRSGQIAAIDNVVIKDAAGNVVYTDDFSTFWGTSDAQDWELFQ